LFISSRRGDTVMVEISHCLRKVVFPPFLDKDHGFTTLKWGYRTNTEARNIN